MKLRPCLAAVALVPIGCAASAPSSLTPEPVEVAVVDLRPAPQPAAPAGVAAANAPDNEAEATPPDAEPGAEASQEFGMIGLLNAGVDPDAASAPWGRDDALAADPLSPIGGLIGSGAGQAFGAGGLGLSGVGSTGGFGVGAGQGFGGAGAPVPKVRMGATSVSGRLPPEVIQRIVRQNFGRFRLCYENGLRSDPNLRGRVTAKFVIGKDGHVSSVTDGGSDMPDGATVSCVLRAFQSLVFPAPEGGGVVVVAYPLKFEPGDSTPPPAPAKPAPAPSKPAPAPAPASP